MQNQIKILVTGKNGQLGQSLNQLTANYPLFTMHFVGRDELDLSSAESIQAYFANNEYDVIINCAAYTAVDKAESEPGLADQINHLAVKQLAEIAKQQDAMLIHISTDYVFNGQNFKPYSESDATDPQSVYGLTKLKGEQAIQAINPKGCIIRTSWVYSEFGNNFVKTMLRLGKEKEQLGIIFDQVGTPTYAGDLAEAILQIIDRTVIARSASDVAIYEASSGLKMDRHTTLAMTEGDAPTKNEVFHFSNEGVCSWYDFAKTIFEYAKIPCVVLPIESRCYPTPATRPHYSLMNKAKIKQAYNLEIPYWKDSLKKCLVNIS
ncbi:NAD(P)-dependent oxidoreductase [Thiomicrorhabdus immobilis]|uniref:dTDP-4-dehydrorhamnose reductase n=1 Tax=Thiomicrorhabdus immobilis TaxID=2791037 RepID=A0ABN6CUU3_9GAMM|nr:dTDP-4-dehydrorhamnose reductase [Thiomicrorhabdus immobilis]BCN92743.1 NAD(P)-dependent oxidoreductase [Thiomicrorhabdus immobilis]